MTSPSSVEPQPTDRLLAAARWVVALPMRFRATLLVWFITVAATYVARRALGDDPTEAERLRLGYGLPAMEDGRWWTLVTGAILLPSLAVPVPSFTFIGMIIYERVAGHWRPLVAVYGGQILGMLIVILAIIPLRNNPSAFAQDVTNVTDFGISVGAFTCLGAWTAYLRPTTRRVIRWAISCYHVGPLLFSGVIYDLSHPTGWFIGLAIGPWLMRPDHSERGPYTTRDRVFSAVAAAIGVTIGIAVGWSTGGGTGIFGWGPTR
ncbi:hypothetical protein [Ilumatobacter nonamiensis]|uniref:hypothetical protein n=1 Tax=Ilumatobacter nonamiensis TaxID=467093 RepID=UPI00034B63F3|nr:hypothetical protein [Ilumatobacter nonamiensis]